MTSLRDTSSVKLPCLLSALLTCLLTLMTSLEGSARPARVAGLRLTEEGAPSGGAHLSQIPARALKGALSDRVELLTPATLAELLPPTLDLSACGAQCPQVIGRATGADLVSHGALTTFGSGLRVRVLFTEVYTGEVVIDELLAGPTPEALEGAILAQGPAWAKKLSSHLSLAEARPLTLISPKPESHARHANWSALGIEWVSLKGGRLMMGNPKGPPKERPVHGVELSPFSVMKAEVTVAQYHRCVVAGACSPPREGEGCVQLSAHSARPVNCVSWRQAERFARWIGARLPTEIEWAFATRGAEGRLNPWGDSPAHCTRATMLGGPQTADEADQGEGCGEGEPSVGCARAQGSSPEGVCDLVGNLSEWVQDDWHHDYKGAPTRGPWCAQPSCAPQARGAKTYRGGSWYHEGVEVSGTSRGFAKADFQGVGVGFRCAL